jgi:hypothetical protein
MPLPIFIDVSGLQKQFNLPKNTADVILQACVEEVTGEIYLNWLNAAKQGLHSTRNNYINGLIKVDRGKFEKAIVLTGKFNNMLEQGASAFDMKYGFMNSAKVKRSAIKVKKDGTTTGGKWYLTIPFRLGAPGSLGESGFSAILPNDVYRAILGIPLNTGLKKVDIPSPYDVPSSRSKIVVPKSNIAYDTYQHKSSIYEGVQRTPAAYGKAIQNTYNSFRRAGENSDPNSWIHKGIKAYNFADKAVQNTDVRLIVENKSLQILNDII